MTAAANIPARFLLLWLLLSCGLSDAVSAAAELPTLGPTVSFNGEPSDAKFRGGVQINGLDPFESLVFPQDELTISLEIQPEVQHVSQAGELLLVAAVDDQTYFMRDIDGAWRPWDGQLETLIPAVLVEALGSSELINVLQNNTAASLGLSALNISMYPAYRLSGAPQQIYYSAAPLRFSVSSYDPLRSHDYEIATVETSMFDKNRQREIPLLIYLPQSTSARPVILFSHGLGGSRYAATYLGKHWAQQGYVAVFMQHPGSDESILVNVPPSQILAVMSEAANGVNSIARIEDVSAVIDQLELWNIDIQSTLFQRLDLQHIGMSGHSFGARTTQSVSGQLAAGFSSTDPRIDAALPLSPSIPSAGSPEAAFGSVTLPWMLMTGTEDVSLITDTTVEDRLAVYPALPPGGKYELVLFEAEHHAFSDGTLNATQSPRNPAHHPIIMSLSTAFWDAWLLGYPDARSWLDGDGARNMLAPQDTFQYK